MKALIDKKGIQAKKHGENKRRLKTFLDILRDLSISYKFSACKGITRKELERHNLLIITTHYPKKYSKREISTIFNFVRKGGSLLLMSNHGDLPGKILMIQEDTIRTLHPNLMSKSNEHGLKIGNLMILLP